MIDQKNIIHELGNALAIMSGYIDLLADTVTGAEQEELVKKVYFSLDLVKQIIKDEAQIKPVSVNIFLNKTVSACRVFIGQKEISFHIISELEYDEFLIEEHKLSQILINLIKNAAKYTEKGEIIISVKRGPSCLEFCVSDTGIGISADDLPHIFEPFVQVSPDKSGSGLGLPICKNLVEGMGGNIWAQSTPGFGSGFYFTIPAIL